eukprot:GDKH01003952.1.p1 GENE.GDKH01003952.1~~GDKH01003952.1.p1  ORF type:complete len:91 (+),score=9.26 GDKH01003952.1:28-273(+)
MGTIDQVISRTKALQVPKPGGVMNIVLGIVNILLPGFGVIIAGAMASDNVDIVLGLFQFLFTFIILGWIWAVVWGVLMILA